jgi:hypothetical protein
MNAPKWFFLVLLSLVATAGQSSEKETASGRVVWESPSADSNGTMPLGNGEVALNAWIEPSGDLRFFIARTDAWDGYGRLLKVGGVRIRIGDGDASRTRSFRQTLTVQDATLRASYGEGETRVELKLWVDANRPVIVVEATSAQPTVACATLELWRTNDVRVAAECSDVLNGCKDRQTVAMHDTVLTGLHDRIGWYHRNGESVGPELCGKIQGMAGFARPDPLLHRTFGALVATERAERFDDRTLRSTTGTRHVFEIAVNTQCPVTAEAWRQATAQAFDAAHAVPLAERRKAHEAWWAAFWERSWIHLSQNTVAVERPDGGAGLPTNALPLSVGVNSFDDASVVCRGYTLQRFITACAGRGHYPIKFNGSLFTVPFGDKPDYADYRRWGPGYWWQNTRLPYESMCASGDFELMEPLFQMYARDLLPQFVYRTRHYLGQAGAYVPECIYFWGDMFSETYGWQPCEERADKLQASRWHKWDWVSGLELSVLLLDRYEYTGDEAFLRDTAMPFVREILTYFDRHYAPGSDGKLVMHPAQALETWWDATNPMPELSGLYAVTERCLALSNRQTTAEERTFWQALRAKLPAMPTMQSPDGKTQLAPAQAFKIKSNCENPELYAVFPFRQFGLGRPNIEWGIEALNHRGDRGPFGWRQEDVFMAYLGQTAQARDYVVQRARRKCASQRFPAFWGPNYDWTPDQCHGGMLMKAVQSMLVQSDGRKLYLLSAWPRDWDCDFKLHAPLQTVVTGTVRDGKLVTWNVTPAERRADVVIGEEK